jgi:flagellin
MLSYNSGTSIGTQVALGKIQQELQKSMQRLSSGLRINSATDDAAGLAISLSMSAKIKSANQASRNAADAISLTQLAEQALVETTGNLTRMRELAVQASTGTLTLSDRKDLQAENDQLVANITQIAKSTKFNGRSLLGNNNSTYLQLGTEAGDGLSISLSSAAAENLGPKGTVSVGGAIVNTASLNNAAMNTPGTAIVINGQQIQTQDDGISTSFAAGSSLAVANGINSSGIAGLSATVGSTVANLGSASVTAPTPGFSTRGVDLAINGVDIGGADWDPDTSELFGQALAARINSLPTGTSAVYRGNQLILTATDGRNIQISSTGHNAPNHTSLSNFNMNSAQDRTVIADLTLTSDLPMKISHGLTAGAGEGRDMPTGVFPFSLASVGTLLSQQSAQDFLSVIDFAMSQIMGIRSQLGVMQNVLGFSVTVNQTASDSLSAATARIMDADTATETASLVRGQILQQAGLSILAQANQSSSSILTLLHGLT